MELRARFETGPADRPREAGCPLATFQTLVGATPMKIQCDLSCPSRPLLRKVISFRLLVTMTFRVIERRHDGDDPAATRGFDVSREFVCLLDIDRQPRHDYLLPR